MDWKNYLKSILPTTLIPYARSGYQMLTTLGYYPQYLFRKGHAAPPRQITFEITYRCNLRCVMCPLAHASDDPDSQIAQEWKVKSELSTDEILQTIDQAAEIGVKTFTITGGEPFLRKDLLSIASHVKRRRLRCMILSNGTLVTKDIAREIVSAGVGRVPP